jgi:predicted PurR-regulated permease PerM
VRWLDWIRPGSHGADTVPTAEQRSEAERLRLERGDIDRLDTVFSAPQWLEDAGRSSWLFVGAFALLGGAMWLAAETFVIVGPVVVGTVIATVAIPLVSAMHRRGLPRAAGAGIVLLGIVALAVAVLVLVLAGIRDQGSEISAAASSGAAKAQSWLESLGVNPGSAEHVNSNVSAAVPGALKTLKDGIVSGIRGLTSIAISVSFLFLALFFLLKDGPSMRKVVDRHLGVPEPVARTITGGVIRSLRGYFKGVTIVAAFNGVVIGLSAWALGVPLPATIGVVNFVLAYIPYLGAFVGGAFAVVLALGAKGTTVAIVMLVIVILANGLLQNIVQPFAMGSALDLHPLVVLIVTIAAGCLFGTLGLILVAPLVSAAVHIKRQLDQARTKAALESPPPSPAAAPAEA